MRTSCVTSYNISFMFEELLEIFEPSSQSICRWNNVQWSWKGRTVVDVIEPKFSSSKLPLYITIFLQICKWYPISHHWGVYAWSVQICTFLHWSDIKSISLSMIFQFFKILNANNHNSRPERICLFRIRQNSFCKWSPYLIYDKR